MLRLRQPARVPYAIVSATALAVAALAGCSPSVDTVESLHEEYVDAGGTCDDLTVSDDRGPWKETGNCSTGRKVLMIFNDEDQRDRAITSLKRLAKQEREKYDGMEGMKGPNWIIYPSSVDDEKDVANTLDANFFSIDEFR